MKGIKVILDYLFLIYCCLKNRSVPGSMVIVYRRNRKGDNEYLLIKSRHSQAITFPSGSLGYKESYREAANRELREETGVRANTLEELPFNHSFRYKNLPLHLKSDQRVFKCLVKNLIKTKPSDSDIIWTKWFPGKQVTQNLSYPELKNMFIKAQRHI